MEEEKKKCIACKELIWADATICLHCQTQQSKQFHKTILVTLKELSAVTVVITLIFAVVELDRFADSWFEDSAYASRLADSASMLLDSGEFTGARKLLQDAKKVYPTSKELGAIQKELAMISIRKIASPRNPDEVQILEDSLHALYHHLGESDENDADVLAHIAWASDLLRDNGYKSVDINLYLDRALDLDESSFYANTYKGVWYLARYNNKQGEDRLTDAERTSKAQQHFNLALQQNVDSDYVRSLQLFWLKYSYTEMPASEYVKLVLDMYARNDKYFLEHRKSILSHLYGSFHSAFKLLKDDKSAYMKKVFLSLNEQDVVSLKELFDLNPNDTNREALGALLSANISEDKGKHLHAIGEYIRAYKLVKDSVSGFRYSVPKLLKKICSRSDGLDQNAIMRCDEFFNQTVKPNHFRL